MRKQTPIRSTLSIQLFTDGQELGALNLLSEAAGGFDAETEEQAINLATHAAIALSSARRGEQFLSALASRDLIGQAKGMIMERFDVDAVAAFRMLRTFSQEMNVPVLELARRIAVREVPVGSNEYRHHGGDFSGNSVGEHLSCISAWWMCRRRRPLRAGSAGRRVSRLSMRASGVAVAEDLPEWPTVGRDRGTSNRTSRRRRRTGSRRTRGGCVQVRQFCAISGSPILTRAVNCRCRWRWDDPGSAVSARRHPKRSFRMGLS